MSGPLAKTVYAVSKKPTKKLRSAGRKSICFGSLSHKPDHSLNAAHFQLLDDHLNSEEPRVLKTTNGCANCRPSLPLLR